VRINAQILLCLSGRSGAHQRANFAVPLWEDFAVPLWEDFAVPFRDFAVPLWEEWCASTRKFCCASLGGFC
jgi:hypothetical protein